MLIKVRNTQIDFPYYYVSLFLEILGNATRQEKEQSLDISNKEIQLLFANFVNLSVEKLKKSAEIV